MKRAGRIARSRAGNRNNSVNGYFIGVSRCFVTTRVDTQPRPKALDTTARRNSNARRYISRSSISASRMAGGMAA